MYFYTTWEIICFYKWSSITIRSYITDSLRIDNLRRNKDIRMLIHCVSRSFFGISCCRISIGCIYSIHRRNIWSQRTNNSKGSCLTCWKIECLWGNLSICWCSTSYCSSTNRTITSIWKWIYYKSFRKRISHHNIRSISSVVSDNNLKFKLTWRSISYIWWSS